MGNGRLAAVADLHFAATFTGRNSHQPRITGDHVIRQRPLKQRTVALRYQTVSEPSIG